jgi:hypothetical protein
MRRWYRPDYHYTARFQRKFPALAAMVIGRNVANVSSIEDFLKGFETDSEEINKWIHAALRKWLIRDYDKTKPYKPQEADPAWMQGKTDLVMVELDEDVHSRIEHVLDFLKAQVAANPNIKLQSFQVAEAFKQAADWVESLKKKKSETEVEGKDFEVILPAGEYRWIKLLTENALVREGNMMGHCVGGYGDRVASGKTVIISLRDAKNDPHATLEYDSKKKEIEQIKGKGNGPLVEKYRPILFEFLKANPIGFKTIDKYDLQSNHILYGFSEGERILLDADNLPNGSTLLGPLEGEGPFKFPEHVKIRGDFSPHKKQILPTILEVNGTFTLDDGLKSVVLPQKLYVRKDFVAEGAKIKEFPKVLQVGGNVLLEGCGLKELPDGLSIYGELDLSNNPIKVLPKKLRVAGELDLMGTKVKVLPDDLEAEAIYLDDNAKVAIPEHLQDKVFQ